MISVVCVCVWSCNILSCIKGIRRFSVLSSSPSSSFYSHIFNTLDCRLTVQIHIHIQYLFTFRRKWENSFPQFWAHRFYAHQNNEMSFFIHSMHTHEHSLARSLAVCISYHGVRISMYVCTSIYTYICIHTHETKRYGMTLMAVCIFIYAYSF